MNARLAPHSAPSRAGWAALALAGAMAAVCFGQEPQGAISGIKAFHWHGQTFLQWEEKEAPQWTTFNVYRSDQPIRDVKEAGVERLATDIIPRSGRSFYALKRNGFVLPVPGIKDRYVLPGKPRPGEEIPVTGLTLPEKQGVSSVTGGLFVHTAGRAGKSWYAVTCTPFGKDEDVRLAAGENLLAAPVDETNEPPQPYLISSRGNVPDTRGEPKLPLTVNLYAIAGTHDAASAESFPNHRTYLLWMPREFGWREGLPTIFTLVSYGNGYGCFLDDSNFAFVGFGNSWWFGYNSEIAHPDRMRNGVVKLYSQKKMVCILNWLFEQYPRIDRRNVGVTGPSMGGTGALLFGLRHPEIFAWISAWVPGGNVVKLPAAKTTLEHLFGPLDADIKCETGESVWNELSNVWYVSKTRADLPFVAVTNSRYDSWMEWPYSVELYRALERGKHACAVWWSPVGHTGSSQFTIPAYNSVIGDNAIRSDTSMPAIVKCSLNEDYGNGKPESGDPYGGRNYQIRWKVEKDAKDEYRITFTNVIPRAATLDFTPRRLQEFKVPPGGAVHYRIVGKSARNGTVQADADGLITIEGVSVVGAAGATVTLTREPPAEPAAKP